MVTTISAYPKELVKYFRCNLLHTKSPKWDGDYIEVDGKKVPNVKWICKECNGKE